MGIIRAAITGSSGLATPERWVEDWFAGGGATPAGVSVSEDTARHYAPWFAGVRLIAEDVASLPLITYERLTRGKRRATEHPLYPVLHDQANPVMSAVALRETMQGHAITWGNGLAYPVRDRAGNVRELWPLHPCRVRPEFRRTGPGPGELWYRYDDPVNGIRAMLAPDEVLHIPGLGGDGIWGWSVLELARNSIGLGVATETYGAHFFGNGSRPGGVLETTGTLSEAAAKRLRADWENLHRGLDRAQRVAILEEGLTWKQVGIPPEDAQFLETRRFQVTEMARWLRLPPHKIADLERSTHNNIEQEAGDYIANTLRIWLVRWEAAIFSRLLTSAERGRFFAEHLLDGMLRGDTKTRYEAYAIGRNWGWFSANDVRELENLNPIDGGDAYMVPLNMVPADSPLPEPERAVPSPRRTRSAAARRRIAAAFRPLIVDADERLAKLERAEVTSLVRRHLEERAGRTRSIATFLDAAEDLYEGLITARTTARWMPLMSALATEISADAAADVGHEDEVDLGRWVEIYVASHVAYRVVSALGQLAAATGRGDDPAAAVLERLDAWVSERPGRTARWECTQLPAAAARETWRAAGVRILRWTTRGDDCPYCRALDGREVGIDDPFASKGEQMDGDDGQSLSVGRNTFHPPLHPGCNCEVTPA